jgi:hypothetical protein
VVVRGVLAEVTNPIDLARLHALPLYPWAPGEKTRYVRVRPLKITGRRIKILDDLPFSWWADWAAPGHAGPGDDNRPSRQGPGGPAISWRPVHAGLPGCQWSDATPDQAEDRPLPAP